MTSTDNERFDELLERSSLGSPGARRLRDRTTPEQARYIAGPERQSLAKDLVKRYNGGESIRSLATATGRSFGFIHHILIEFGVQLRQRGRELPAQPRRLPSPNPPTGNEHRGHVTEQLATLAVDIDEFGGQEAVRDPRPPRRIVGAERQTLAKDLVKRYNGGESIRSLAASTGRSYGFIHRVLTESGVQLRQRGGARRRGKDGTSQHHAGRPVGSAGRSGDSSSTGRPSDT